MGSVASMLPCEFSGGRDIGWHASLPEMRRSHIRFGSEADIGRALPYVRVGAKS